VTAVAAPADAKATTTKRRSPREKFITRRRRMETALDLFAGTCAAGFGGYIWMRGLGGRRSLFLGSHLLSSFLYFLVADERQKKQVTTHEVKPVVQVCETGASALWCVSGYRQLMANNYSVWFTGHNATTALFVSLYFSCRLAATYYGWKDTAPTWDGPEAERVSGRQREA
jgi:hypothetical protein